MYCIYNALVIHGFARFSDLNVLFRILSCRTPYPALCLTVSRLNERCDRDTSIRGDETITEILLINRLENESNTQITSNSRDIFKSLMGDLPNNL